MKQAQLHLLKIPKWKLKNDLIYRTFKFKTFVDGITFVTCVAQIADKMNHHPDINIRWNKVRLATTTHDKDGLTVKDFLLAQDCDKVFTGI